MGAARVVWALCLVGTGALLVVAPSGWTAALAALTVLLPVLFALAAYAASKKLSADVKGPETCEKNAAAEMTLKMENRSLFPALHVQLDIAVQNLLTGEQVKLRKTAALGSRETLETGIEFRSRHCGAMRLSLQRVMVRDIFGIFGFRADGGEEKTFLVAPSVFDVRLIFPEATSSAVDSEEYSQTKPGRDFSEVFQIRDYAEGDSPKQIHWKLSTKSDRLVVRDPSLPLERSVLLLWERGNLDESAEQSDAMADVLVSICRALVQQNIGCRLVWNGADTEICNAFTARNEEELYDLLPKLLAAGTCRESVTEEFLRLYGPEKDKKVIFLTSADNETIEDLCTADRLTVLLCGSEASAAGKTVAFTAEDAAEMLFELDLS